MKANFTKGTILIINSLSQSRGGIAEKINEIGFNAIEAVSCEAALKTLKQNILIELIILDSLCIQNWTADKNIQTVISENNIPILVLADTDQESHLAESFENYGIISRNSPVFLIKNSIKIASAYHSDKNTLTDAEINLRNYLDNLPDSIWVKDINGVYIYCNKLCEKFLRAKYSQIIGKTDYDFTDKKTAEIFRMNDRLALAANRPTINEDEITIASDGHIEYSETIKTPIYDSQNRAVGVIGIARNITKRINAIKEIAEEKEQSEEIINSLPGLYYQINSDGQFVRWNKEFEKISGYSSTELQSLSPTDFFYDNDKEYLSNSIQKAFNDGYAEAEALFVPKNGLATPFYFTASRTTIKGTPYIHGMAVDLTILKETQKELIRISEREHFLADIYLKSPIAISIAYSDGNLYEINEMFSKITGYSKAEILSQKNLKHLTPDKWIKSETKMIKSISFKNTFVSYEKELIKKDGTIIPVLFVVMGNYNDTGTLLNYVTYIQDISEQKRLENNLRNTQKLEAIGTLASGVAHEINNPINGIMNYSQLILDESNKDDSVYGYAEEIINETTRVSEIVKNLLKFSRQEIGHYTVEKVQDIIESTLSLIRTIIKRDQIILKVDIQKNLPPIVCRGQQLQQVIMNLLTNARDSLNQKYEEYDEKKIIHISCKTITKYTSRWIRITVEDFGLGIPKNIQNHIFEPFFTTKRDNRGTGLGLSISYGIVKEHNGELSFETKQNGYTRFYVDLPITNLEES